MCVVSMIGDHWKKGWEDRYPDYVPWISPEIIPTGTGPIVINNGPTREEFEALKKELEALKELLKAAKIYDEKTGQPECHNDDKVELIKKLADLVGVDLKDVL